MLCARHVSTIIFIRYAHGQNVGKTNNMKVLEASKPKIADMIFFLEWMVYLNIIKFAYTCTFAVSVDTYFDDSIFIFTWFNFSILRQYWHTMKYVPSWQMIE